MLTLMSVAVMSADVCQLPYMYMYLRGLRASCPQSCPAAVDARLLPRCLQLLPVNSRYVSHPRH